MDRHFIFPTDWEKRKRKDEWDADPSLKGKRISVQGTSLFLDTPEAIDAWIAERKKRWPSAARVADKEMNLQEAIARGQIISDDATLRGNKRRRTDDGPSQCDRGRGRGRGGGQRGGLQQRGEVSGNRVEGFTKALVHHPLPAKPTILEESSDDSSSDSGSDIDMEKDAVSTKIPPPGYPTDRENNVGEEQPESDAIDAAEINKLPATKEACPELPVKPIKRKHANQPKPTPYNAFSHRPSLLRNLLLPEIRMTISNFSQALRFLVENDFLENVEVKPGEAASKSIEVIEKNPIAQDKLPADENVYL